jgi:hypothetical protein
VAKASGGGATALYIWRSRPRSTICGAPQGRRGRAAPPGDHSADRGDDTSSAINEDEVLSKAGRVDALVYASASIRANGVPVTDGPSAVFLNAWRGRAAASSVPGSWRISGKFYRDLSDELRHQYVLGYVPAGSKAGARWHAITVRVKNRKDYRLRHRTGTSPPARGPANDRRVEMDRRGGGGSRSRDRGHRPCARKPARR